MYDISYNIHVCTQVCCALFCAVMIWVSHEITRSFSSYSSCLLHWHWDHLAWFVASELILRDMEKFVTQPQQNTRKLKSSAYFLGCVFSIVQRLPILTRTPSHERPRPTHSDKSLWYVPYWSSHGCIGASIRRHLHVDVMTWKRFPYNWTFFPRIHQSPMDFPSKGTLTGTFQFLCVVSQVYLLNNGSSCRWLEIIMILYKTVTIPHSFGICDIDPYFSL